MLHETKTRNQTVGQITNKGIEKKNRDLTNIITRRVNLRLQLYL